MTHAFAALAALLMFGLVGCTAADLESPPRDHPAVAVEQDRFVLVETNQGWEVDFPFSFTNVTGDAVSILNCNGAYQKALERYDGNRWVTAWSAIIPMCLSAPIVIPPGQSHDDVLRLSAGFPSSNVFPQFTVDTIDGTYRLVIGNVYWNYDHAGPPWGDLLEIEYRTSAPFEIRLP